MASLLKYLNRQTVAIEGVLSREPQTLANNQSVIVDCRGVAWLTLVPRNGGTASYHRWMGTEESDGGAGDPVDATEATSIEVQWPFYRISTAGGATDYAVA
jgi:hypothetical protein